MCDGKDGDRVARAERLYARARDAGSAACLGLIAICAGLAAAFFARVTGVAVAAGGAALYAAFVRRERSLLREADAEIILVKDPVVLPQMIRLAFESDAARAAAERLLGSAEGRHLALGDWANLDRLARAYTVQDSLRAAMLICAARCLCPELRGLAYDIAHSSEDRLWGRGARPAAEEYLRVLDGTTPAPQHTLLTPADPPLLRPAPGPTAPGEQLLRVPNEP